jgi:hypothetical protein
MAAIIMMAIAITGITMAVAGEEAEATRITATADDVVLIIIINEISTAIGQVKGVMIITATMAGEDARLTAPAAVATMGPLEGEEGEEDTRPLSATLPMPVRVCSLPYL